MSRMRVLLSVLFIGFYVQGCAPGPSFRQIEKEIPALAANQARIFFLQSTEYSGSDRAHEVRLNGFYIGKSVPGSFIFVDRNAGTYMVHCSSDRPTFTLKAEETKYIELVPTVYGDNPLGVRIVPISHEEGEAMIRKLAFAGRAYRAG